MLSNFITEFKSSSSYEELFNGRKVVMIYVTGSRLLGITDDRSDYDIMVIVDGEGNDYPDEIWTYEGKKVHWYYRELSKFVTENRRQRLRSLKFCGNIYFSLVQDEHIIFENAEYESVINELKANKRDICLNAAKLLYESRKFLIHEILCDETIKEANYTKFIYHLCVASYILRNEPFDVDMLREIKRIRWQPVSDECKQKAVERIHLLDEYFKDKNHA